MQRLVETVLVLGWLVLLSWFQTYDSAHNS